MINKQFYEFKLVDEINSFTKSEWKNLENEGVSTVFKVMNGWSIGAKIIQLQKFI